MKAVSDRQRNPFDIDPPCPGGSFVPGFGDPAGDFHCIGDHPVHDGGVDTGVPFTGSERGMALQSVLERVGLLRTADPVSPVAGDLFMNYLYMCSRPPAGGPSEKDYQEFERFFDAELRAVNAHILLPVGRRPTDHVLRFYTTRFSKEPRSMARRHASEIRGRGFLVVPIADPNTWTDASRDRLIQTLEGILASDYRQTKGVATLVG